MERRTELRPFQPAAWARATAKLKNNFCLLFAHVRQKKKKDLRIALSSEAPISKTHIKCNKINWLQAQSFKAWKIAASLIFILCKKIVPAREKKSSCQQLKKQPPHKYCCKILLHGLMKCAGKHMLHPPLVLNYYRITT